MSREVVFITSRAHSGSTLLNLLLSGHSRLIAMGEIYSLFDFEAGHIYRQEKIKCSCGAAMQDCLFWGPTTDHLRENPHLSKGQMYDYVLDMFYDYFGPDYIPVDASKSMDALTVLHGRKVDLKVIFLLRDVRPWVVSMRREHMRNNDFYLPDLFKKYRFKAPLAYLWRTPIKYFWHWYLLNRKTQRYLNQTGIPALQVGYEEISLYPEKMVSTIGKFLDLVFDPNMITLVASENHVILGNRMRHQPDKRSRIYYDNRWFYHHDWVLPSVLFPQIMKYNAREVYANTRAHLWQ